MTSDVVKSNRPAPMKANKTVAKEKTKRFVYYSYSCDKITKSLELNLTALFTLGVNLLVSKV